MNTVFDREKVLKSYIENKEKLDKRNNEGIEKYRKGNFKIKFAENIKEIHVRQTKHKFLFGCTAFMLNSFEAPEKEVKFKELFSNLFNQAVVSAELVLGDPVFVGKANEKIKEHTANPGFVINTNGERPTIILAIISEDDDERPQIPFFSKVALRYTRRRLETDGCKVFIKNIRKA